MGRTATSFENRDKFVQLGMAIAVCRRQRGMSQDKLADEANISRAHLSAIEAPNLVRGISLNLLYTISDALHVQASDILALADTFVEQL